MTSQQRTRFSEWKNELFLVEQEMRLKLEPLSEAQFAWRPGANRWSVGECLNHLAITTDLMPERVRLARVCVCTA